MRAKLMRTVILCEVCTREGRTSVGKIADHITPLAQGGTGDRSNYQLLCQDCSDAKTLAERGRSARAAGGVDVAGRPTDPHHPWNRR